ncbi:MliC family protein [Bradyrhizobium sp. Tv2a-2]|uniref:MliC family protein n=1 Tax=Bradyrhizobium sp. Tv2a-2 TaxID=113395 RepID=UPI0004678EE8|nr:MliC family protein [Bradyrhizobium sp. Tv2a-2]
MKRSEISLRGLVCVAVLGTAPVHAQSFQTYHCADGTQFIVGFYPYDPRAYVQIDGREITLPKRLALSGTRYSGGDVTLKMTKAGVTTIRHARRREAACELFK